MQTFKCDHSNINHDYINRHYSIKENINFSDEDFSRDRGKMKKDNLLKIDYSLTKQRKRKGKRMMGLWYWMK